MSQGSSFKVYVLWARPSLSDLNLDQGNMRMQPQHAFMLSKLGPPAATMPAHWVQDLANVWLTALQTWLQMLRDAPL